MRKKERGLKNERFQKKLKQDGSISLPKSNDFGVRVAKSQVIKGKPISQNIIESNVNDSTINWAEVNSAEYDVLYGQISEQELHGGIVGGKLIRPKYDTTELEKSIDTRIFELIPNTPAPQPDTVPRPVYNTALEQIDDLTAEVERLNIEVGNLNSTISELEIINESLRIEADNEKLQANIANEQRNVANTQIASTTIDLQNAVQNSINEAVQRVSLTARVEALQESFRVQKELTEEREKQNAAQNALEGVNGFFQQTENSGWKISSGDIQTESIKGLYIETYNDDDVYFKNGEKGVAFFNFSTEEQTFTLSYAGNKFEGYEWFNGPTTFKVPARNEQTAGVTTAKFRFKNLRKQTSKRKRQVNSDGATVTINTSSGDKLTLKAYYWKEVKRKDTWDVVGSALVTVGEDKTGG
jgi:hypothetical protein